LRRLLHACRFGLVTTALGLVVLAAGAEPAHSEFECTCRYAGMSYEQNTCVCITTSSGQRFACCEKVLNNTSWSFKGGECPIAAAPHGRPAEFPARGDQRSTDRARLLSAISGGDIPRWSKGPPP
jgi:hypothetical protein